MAALTQDRNTPFRFIQRKIENLQVAASTEIFAGALVCLNAGGFAVPAGDTAGLGPAIGRASEHVDNSAGANGDLTITVECGVFKYVAGTAIDQALVGTTVACEDDQTVADPADVGITNDVPAGRLEEIDADGDAWVAVGLGV